MGKDEIGNLERKKSAYHTPHLTIVQVAERLPARVFEDDPQLMMYAGNARLRADALPKQEKLL